MHARGVTARCLGGVTERATRAAAEGAPYAQSEITVLSLMWAEDLVAEDYYF